ncbi:hypothetical protein QQ045_029774 [Rhodiola kirilowii]
MEIISPVVAALSVALLFLALPVYGQPGLPPCTPAMLTSFTPCMNFLSNATANVTTPTPDCCNTLKSLTTNSSGCLCLLVTGSVPPFPVPIAINRTLAISLPQACNMPGVPVRCKASTTAPIPAPGPASVALSPPTPDSDTPQGVPGPASSTTPVGSGGATAPSSSAISSTSLSSLVVHGLGMLFIIYS